MHIFLFLARSLVFFFFISHHSCFALIFCNFSCSCFAILSRFPFAITFLRNAFYLSDVIRVSTTFMFTYSARKRFGIIFVDVANTHSSLFVARRVNGSGNPRKSVFRRVKRFILFSHFRINACSTFPSHYP